MNLLFWVSSVFIIKQYTAESKKMLGKSLSYYKEWRNIWFLWKRNRNIKGFTQKLYVMLSNCDKVENCKYICKLNSFLNEKCLKAREKSILAMVLIKF